MLLLLSRFSRVLLLVTARTAAYQASPSVGFSRQEYWKIAFYEDPWGPHILQAGGVGR